MHHVLGRKRLSMTFVWSVTLRLGEGSRSGRGHLSTVSGRRGGGARVANFSEKLATLAKIPPRNDLDHGFAGGNVVCWGQFHTGLTLLSS